MFWILLVGLYGLMFPLNYLLLCKIWYKWYPVPVYQVLGEEVLDEASIMKAQIRAILLFGTLQSFLASVPMLFGSLWWQYLVCLLASAFYSASGSPRFFLDRVRSSYPMRFGTVVTFGIGAIVFTLIRR
jgi:hypothetical protein